MYTHLTSPLPAFILIKATGTQDRLVSGFWAVMTNWTWCWIGRPFILFAIISLTAVTLNAKEGNILTWWHVNFVPCRSTCYIKMNCACFAICSLSLTRRSSEVKRSTVLSPVTRYTVLQLLISRIWAVRTQNTTQWIGWAWFGKNRTS